MADVTSIAEEYNFFNPFMSARIITQTDSFPLWTSGATSSSFQNSAKALNGLNALAFVREITVENQLGDIPIISVTLTPPYEDGIKFIDSELIEFGQKSTNMRLQVQIGYANTGGKTAILSDIFEGALLKPPEVRFGADMSITLHAQGIGGSTAAGQVASARTFKGVTLGEAVTQLCQAIGWGIDLSLANKYDRSQKAFAQTINECQGWNTDLFFLRQLLRKAGCSMYMTQDSQTGKGVCQVLPHQALYSDAQPTHILSLYGTPGTLGGVVYPILTAQSSFSAMWLTGIRKLIMRDIDNETKQLTKKTFDDSTEKAPVTWGGSADPVGSPETVPKPSDDGTENYIHAPGDPKDQEAILATSSAYSQYRLAFAIDLDLETIGVPTLTPRQVVAVSGLGMRLDTRGPHGPKYAVQKVVHRIGAGGYTTSIHAIANTAGELVAQDAAWAPASGPVNQNDVPKDDNSNTVAMSSDSNDTGVPPLP